MAKRLGVDRPGQRRSMMVAGEESPRRTFALRERDADENRQVLVWGARVIADPAPIADAMV